MNLIIYVAIAISAPLFAAQDISFGPVEIAEKRINLSSNDFNIKFKLETQIAAKAVLKNDSI